MSAELILLEKTTQHFGTSIDLSNPSLTVSLTGWTQTSNEWNVSAGNGAFFTTDGTESELSQAIDGISEDGIYQITFEVANRTAGAVTVRANNTIIGVATLDDSYSFTFTGLDGNVLVSQISFQNTTGLGQFDGVIKNVSISTVPYSQVGGTELTFWETYGELDVQDDDEFAISYSRKDLKSLGRASADFSSTGSLPFSQSNTRLLGHLDHNLPTFDSFDSRKTWKAVRRQNGVPIFEGFFNLQGVKKNNTSGNEGSLGEFSYQIYGDQANLWDTLSQRKLADLDVSELNHIWGASAITESWENRANDPQKGYYYPLLANAYNAHWKLEHFYPSFHMRYLLNKMVLGAGYTYELSPKLTTWTENLYLTYQGDKIKLSDAQQKFFSSFVGQTGLTAIDSETNYASSNTNFYTFNGIGGQGTNWTPFTTFGIDLEDETSGQFFDIGNNWDNVSGIFTCNHSGEYTFNFECEVELSYVPSSGAVFPEGRIIDFNDTATEYWENASQGGKTGVQVNLVKQTLDNQWVSIHASEQVNPSRSQPLPASGQVMTSGSISFSKTVELLEGERVFPQLRNYNYWFFADNEFTPLLNDAWTGVTQRVVATASTLEIRPKNHLLAEGDLMDMQRMLPDIGQEELFDWFIKAFNVIIDTSYDNSQHLILKTWDEFWQTDEVVNLTPKVDGELEIEFPNLPARYEFNNKESDDVWNETYTDTRLKQYGEKTYNFTTDSGRGQEDITLPSVPTLYTRSLNGIFTPAIDCEDVGDKFRVVQLSEEEYLDKTIEIQSPDQNLTGYTSNFFNGYRVAGHLNSITGATRSIQWDNIDRELIGHSLGSTLNTLFYQFYWNSIKTLDEQKIFTAYIDLDEEDINRFRKSFATKVQIYENLYQINKIINYKPLAEEDRELTKVELIPFIEYDSSYLTSIEGLQTESPIDNTDVSSQFGDPNISDTFAFPPLIDTGDGNQNDGFQSVFIGDRNMTTATRSIQLGDDNVFQADIRQSLFIGNNNTVIGDGTSGDTSNIHSNFLFGSLNSWSGSNRFSVSLGSISSTSIDNIFFLQAGGSANHATGNTRSMILGGSGNTMNGTKNSFLIGVNDATVTDDNVINLGGKIIISDSGIQFTDTVSGSGIDSIVVVTASTNVLASVGNAYMMDCSSGDLTVTLPKPSESANAKFIVKKLDATANNLNLVISDVATDNIDGATASTISTQYDSITVLCDGVSSFHIV